MLFSVEYLSWLPGSSQQRQQPTVQSDPTGIFPCQNQEYRKGKQKWINRGRTSHHEVPIHETAQECGNAREGAQN
jgi:hypothetical protein